MYKTQYSWGLFGVTISFFFLYCFFKVWWQDATLFVYFILLYKYSSPSPFGRSGENLPGLLASWPTLYLVSYYLPFKCTKEFATQTNASYVFFVDTYAFLHSKSYTIFVDLLTHKWYVACGGKAWRRKTGTPPPPPPPPTHTEFQLCYLSNIRKRRAYLVRTAF